MQTYAVLSTFVARDTPLDPNDVKPGWVALSIVVLLCIATYFLARSFLKHSRAASQPWDGEDAETPSTTPHERR